MTWTLEELKGQFNGRQDDYFTYPAKGVYSDLYNFRNDPDYDLRVEAAMSVAHKRDLIESDTFVQQYEEYVKMRDNEPVKDKPAPFPVIHTANPGASRPSIISNNEASQDQYKPLTIVSAFDLNSNEYTKPEYIVDGVLYPGLTILAGPPKYGKSYLVLDLACSVATGSTFLGRATKQGDVLYLDLEGTEWRTNERLTQLGYALCPDRLAHTYQADTVDRHLLRQLTDQIESDNGMKLIIIDTMARIKGNVRRGENGYAAEYRFLFPLHELALQKSVAVVGVTHTRKGNGLPIDDPMEMIIGSQAQYGTADGGWVLTGKREESGKVLHCAGRDYEQVDLALDFAGGKWITQGTVEEMEQQRAAASYKTDPAIKTILHLVESSGGSWTGTMQELFNEVAMLTGEYPAKDATRLAEHIRPYFPLLKKEDGVLSLPPSGPRKVNGKSRKEYTFRQTKFVD